MWFNCSVFTRKICENNCSYNCSRWYNYDSFSVAAQSFCLCYLWVVSMVRIRLNWRKLIVSIGGRWFALKFVVLVFFGASPTRIFFGLNTKWKFFFVPRSTLQHFLPSRELNMLGAYVEVEYFLGFQFIWGFAVIPENSLQSQLTVLLLNYSFAYSTYSFAYSTYSFAFHSSTLLTKMREI